MSEPTAPTPDPQPDPEQVPDPEPAPDLDYREPDRTAPGLAGPDVAELEPTGHGSVDAALRAVADAAGAPPADQLPAYQAAHRVLRETLASIDEG